MKLFGISDGNGHWQVCANMGDIDEHGQAYVDISDADEHACANISDAIKHD